MSNGIEGKNEGERYASENRERRPVCLTHTVTVAVQTSNAPTRADASSTSNHSNPTSAHTTNDATNPPTATTTITSRYVGISADDPARSISDVVLRLVAGVETALGLPAGSLGGAARCEIDDTFVGDGYGVASDESGVAQQMAARFEAIVTDHWYTAKALAGLISRARRGEFDAVDEVLFWHTGGQPSALIADG